MSKSKIAWTDETWNPVTGCTKTSAGCAHCYAQRMAKRLKGRFGYPADEPFRVTFHPDRLDQPMRWRKPRRVFVCSMGDLWHPDVKPCDRAAVIRATNAAPQHTYIFLTKRPERFDGAWAEQENFWLGTSVENADYTDRIELLRKTPAAIRFLSIEPLLGPIPRLPLRGIDWVIVGGESGPGARPMKRLWVRDIRDQCIESNVPFFFKQWGTAKRKSGNGLPWLDGRTWGEYPIAKSNSQ